MRHRLFHAQNTLRTAKAAIGGVALGIGAQPVAFNAQRGHEIGPVGMKHGAVADRQRQIGRPATADMMHEIGRHQPPLGIGADLVGNAEIMPFASNGHVVVAVVAHLAGPGGGLRHHRTGDGQRVSLAFLAAKPPAHAPHFHPHVMQRQPQRMGHLVLDLAGVLGRAMHHHPALGGLRQCRLTLQIEMLLPTNLDRALHPVHRPRQRRRHIALCPGHGPALEPAVGRKRLIQRQNRRLRGIGDLRLAGRHTGRAVACRGHQKDRLADVMHRPLGQHRLGLGRGRGIIGMGQIGGGDHRHHAGAGPHRAQIERGDPGRRLGGQAKGQMQGIGGAGQVIQIACLPGDMQPGRVMRQRLSHAHGCTSSTETVSPLLSRR